MSYRFFLEKNPELCPEADCLWSVLAGQGLEVSELKIYDCYESDVSDASTKLLLNWIIRGDGDVLAEGEPAGIDGAVKREIPRRLLSGIEDGVFVLSNKRIGLKAYSAVVFSSSSTEETRVAIEAYYGLIPATAAERIETERGSVNPTVRALLGAGRVREAVLAQFAANKIFSTREYTEQADCTLGGKTVLMPVGGRNKLTEEQVYAVKTDTLYTLSACGSPNYATSKLVAAGADISTVAPNEDGTYTASATRVIPATYPEKGKLVWLKICDANSETTYAAVSRAIAAGQIKAASAVGEGGVVGAVMTSALGNGFGVELYEADEEYFAAYIGDIVVLTDKADFTGCDYYVVGELRDNGKVMLGDEQLPIETAVKMYRMPIEKKLEIPSLDYSIKTLGYSFTGQPVYGGKVKPRVVIPEIIGDRTTADLAESFEAAGAKVSVVTIDTTKDKALLKSIDTFLKTVDTAQILALSGEGSTAALMSSILKERKLSESIAELLEDRRGLILGLGIGFNVLLRSGILPDVGNGGKTVARNVWNRYGRGVGTLARVRITSNLSPWFGFVNTGETYLTPIGTGSGCFNTSVKQLEDLILNGQVATQYVDLNGNAAMNAESNPLGSMYAVESITSPDGRVLGMQGHQDRTGAGLYINVPGRYDMKLFKAGVKYFKQ